MSLLVAEAKLWLELSPAYLGDVDLGIREQLNASLLQHVSALHGTVLAYDSLKLLDGLGCIRADQPHLHLPVSLRVLVFAPRIGNVLTGVVRRQGTDHAALLVHGMFSAAVAGTRPRVEGEKLHFVIRSLQVTDGMLSLVGEPSTAAHSAPADLPMAGSSSPDLQVTSSRPVGAREAVGFLKRFLDEGANAVHADVLAHMQAMQAALEQAGEEAGPEQTAEQKAPQPHGESPKKKKTKKKDTDTKTAVPTPATPASVPAAAPAAAANRSSSAGAAPSSTKQAKEQNAGTHEKKSKEAKKKKKKQKADDV